MNQSNFGESFWNERYLQGETGWDLSGISPPLALYIDELKNRDTSILIPGCGNAYEAEYLLDKGFTNVTLIDIAPELVKKLKIRFANRSIEIIHGDFFRHVGHYDLILEQTFFCAIHPSLRKQYVLKAHELLNPEGKIAGLLFNKMFEKDGPPFGGTREEYEALFRTHFQIIKMDECNTSVKPRLGNELFIELKSIK